MVRRKLWVKSDQLELNSQGEVEVGCLHKIIDFCCFVHEQECRHVELQTQTHSLPFNVTTLWDLSSEIMHWNVETLMPNHIWLYHKSFH